VVSAKEGVQAHTLNLWASLVGRKLPVVGFVNKIDRDGVDAVQVCIDFEKDLGTKLFALNTPDLSNPDRPRLIGFGESRKLSENFKDTKIIETSLENLAECDEEFLEQYIEGEAINVEKVLAKAEKKIMGGKLHPVLFGSAKLEMGIEDLLNTIATFISQLKTYSLSPSAKVFKVSFDEKQGRLAHLKSYGGVLRSKEVIRSKQLDKDIKINQLFKPQLGSLEQITELHPGEIGIVSTSDIVLAGDVLGAGTSTTPYSKIGNAILSVQVIPKEDKDYQKLGEALDILNLEDPTLEFRWFKEEREFHLKILGPIQTEVLKDSLSERWNIEAEFLQPKVIYKETPTTSAEGYVRYWMPKPCWAIMTFLIEPAPPGSGVTFNNKVRTSNISKKYINEVKRAIPWSLKQGIHGYEVTDLSITLIEGSEHTVHSNPGDFLLATPMGVLSGLENAGSTLLEPMYAFEIKASQDLLGPISSDLNQLQAQINAPLLEDGFFTMRGRLAVAAAMNFSIKFNAPPPGTGLLTLTLKGSENTETTADTSNPYRGVPPSPSA